MESTKSRKRAAWVVALIGILLLLFLIRGCVWKESNYPVQSDPDLLSILVELREELEWPGISVETAAANLETPEAIVDFVKEGTIYLPYHGTFASPDAVLRTRAANSVDRVRLTQALLEKKGFETRIRKLNPHHRKPKNPISGNLVRDTPKALQKLADYLNYDLSVEREEMSQLHSEFDVLVKSLKEETSLAFEQIETLVPGLFTSPPPTPLFAEENVWVWVEYRSPNSEEWLQADPTYEDKPTSYYNEDVNFADSKTRIQLEGIRGDGKRVNLMSWSGEAVGHDVEMLFVPADRKPEELRDILEPNEIWTWAPVLQIGSETVRGNPFTPEGAVLSNLNGSPASFFDDDGNLDFYAPEVKELSIANAVCGDGDRVRVRLNAATLEAPRWHVGHFTLKDNGKPVKRLRMEKAGSQPKPVILVIDISGSMTGEREKMARTAVNQFAELLPENQKLGLITHGYGKVATIQELAPKKEGKAVEAFGKAMFWGQEQILPATLAALKMADEPATIIFLTDGEDTMAQQSSYPDLLVQTLESLRNSDSIFIPVGIGEADPILMTQLAEASGTEYIKIDQPERLPDLYSQLGTALSGSIELSYIIPEKAEIGSTRELTVEMEGFDGDTTASYSVDEGTEFGLVRIEVTISGNPNLNLSRTLVDFSDGYDGWRMMTKASLWMSPSTYPQHIVESRRIDEWIESLVMADFVEGSDLNLSLLNRSFSFQQGSTLNRIRTWHSAISPQASLPLGPTVWMTRESLRLEGEDVIKRSVLDWIGGFDWQSASSREELVQSFLGLLSAEGAVWALDSVNSSLLTNTTGLKAYGPADSLPEGVPPTLSQLQGTNQNSVIIINPENPSVGWRVDKSTGGVYGYVSHGHEIAKGASLEQTAAKFRELRSILQLYSYFGGGGLSAAFSPAGGVFSALCSYFDQIVRQYCFATIMMQQVGDAIASGGEDFDPEEAKATAERLCETSGDPEEFARSLLRETGYGFVRGTAESVVAAGVASGIGDAAGVSAGSLADAAVSGAASSGVAAADPTPGTAAEIPKTIGIGNPSAVSVPSLVESVNRAVFGD